MFRLGVVFFWGGGGLPAFTGLSKFSCGFVGPRWIAPCFTRHFSGGYWLFTGFELLDVSGSR